MALEKATLTELDQKFENPLPGGKVVEVQFNPELLKMTFANAIVQPQGGDQSAGNSGRQFVGDGTTKLALQLWFDATAMEKDPVDDVRRVTSQVVYFITPHKTGDRKKCLPPGVQFQWGTFIFKGMVDGLEESLEYFSPDGKPLRASITLTLSQQKILEVAFEKQAPANPGEAPLNAARQGESLQNMAARAGKDDWQSIAAANGIEDPLRMAPGALVDLNIGVDAGATFGVTAGGSIGLTVGASGAGASLGASLNASLGGTASASVTLA